MEWRDEGILLSAQKHGEGSAVIEVFTTQHGRHAGLVRGGSSRKMAPILQPGSQISVIWKARLEEHLGSFTIDPIKSRAVNIMSDKSTLAVMGAITSLLKLTLPEREDHQRLYVRTLDLVDAIGVTDDWPSRYALWENALLTETGFALDLEQCAATGVTQDLIYVSPKSGCAVSRNAGEEWADRMLPLPRFLRLDSTMNEPAEVQSALKTTGYFLEKWVMPAVSKQHLPNARQRLIEALLQVK